MPIYDYCYNSMSILMQVSDTFKFFLYKTISSYEINEQTNDGYCYGDSIRYDKLPFK